MENNVFQEIELDELLNWNLPIDITYKGNECFETKENDKQKSILDHIFPPKEWTLEISEGEIRTYRQTVSRESSSKRSVIALSLQLDKYLQACKATKKGISKMRSAVIKLAFDEILRQVVVESEDLGVILLRTYNELRKIKFLWEFLSERGLDYFDSLTTSLNFDDLKFQNQIEHLKKVNNDLTLKFNKAEMIYYNKSNAQIYHVRCLQLAEKQNRIQKNNIKASTRQLKEQCKILMQPVALLDED